MPSAEDRDAPSTAVVRTFLFTDIEGSTRTWRSAPDGTAAALERHDAILRKAVEDHGGLVVKHTGDGVLAVFDGARAAARAAVDAQRALIESVPLSVRMALNTGEAHARDDDWFGPAVNRCSRLLEAGHGGQILVSAATQALLHDVPLPGTRLDNLGEHRLRDLPEPEGIYQLSAPGLAERHPPLRKAAAPLHTLPATRTPLVGREREIGDLADLLSRTRLVTITGVGGVGKTRLAIETASRMLDLYPGGVFFAELASATTSAGVRQAVLDATGNSIDLMAGGASAEDQLLRFLAPRQALVVLDNCEHILDDCCAIVDAILDACPLTTIVATSREPLDVDGERVWRAPSLGTDGADAEAVHLFLERAAPYMPGSLDGDDLAQVAEICRHLDGIPLAIELAAAQTAHLSLSEIAVRLTDRFSLLTGGRRRVQRQQTLYAAVEWSHELLRDPERILLRRLAAFPGWFDLPALEAVCGDLPEPPQRLLGSLVAKSLVVPDARRTRYRLLETIRAFAEERLVGAGEAEHVRDRHCHWVFQTVERIGAAAGRTLDGLESTIDLLDDLRAALQWSIARGELERAGRAFVMSGTVWWVTGRNEEGLSWLEAVERANLDVSDRSWLLSLRAALLIGWANRSESLAAVDAVRRIDPDEISPSRLQADTIAAVLQLADPGAEDRIDDLIQRASRADDPYFLRQARDYRAHLWFVTDPSAALAEWAALVDTSDRNRRGIADFYAMVDLGGGWHVMGDHDRTLSVADELDRRGFSIGHGVMASAARYLRTLALAGLGDLDGARANLAALRQDLRSNAARSSLTECGLACVATLVSALDFERASELLGAIRGGTSDFRGISPISFAIHRHYTLATRRHLPDGVARRLYDEGRRSDPLALIDDALERWSSADASFV